MLTKFIQFTALENAPFYTRLIQYFQQTALQVFGYALTSQYISYKRSYFLEARYLVIDYIGEGKMLSESQETFRYNQSQRANLFRDIYQIILSLAQSPFPYIGSLIIDNCSVLSLANRPLTLQLQQLENRGILTNIPRNLTYSATDAYFLDLLAYYNSRI